VLEANPVIRFVSFPASTFARLLAAATALLKRLARGLGARRHACRRYSCRPADRFETEYEADYLLDRFGPKAPEIARRQRNAAFARGDVEGARLWSAVRLHLTRLVCEGARCAWEPDAAFLAGAAGSGRNVVGFRRRGETGAPVGAPPGRSPRPAVVRRLRPRQV